MKILCPIKKTVWGKVDNLETLKAHIAKSGQNFGVDESGPACNYNSSYPCNQTLYQYMGWGPHKGLDIPVATGTEIYASHDGVVKKTSESITQGIGIVLQNAEVETVYWHNRNNVVKAGDIVKAGDLIAYSDNTGFSGGPHLHWEVKPWNGTSYEAVDPIPLITFNMEYRIVRSSDGTAEQKKNIYRLKDGAKDLFLNGKSFEALDGRWDEVETMKQEALDAIPEGLVLIAVANE